LLEHKIEERTKKIKMDGTIAQLPQMENSRIPHQAMQWKRRGYKQHG